MLNFNQEENTNCKTFTVTQLNTTASDLLLNYFNEIIVEGEISNFIQAKSHHWYFSLKDQKSSIRCVMFCPNNLKVKFKPINGKKIQVKAEVKIYSERGEFQLLISEMQQFGEGDLKKQYEELLKKLSKKGLFLEKHKKLIPKIPTKIGIITSPTGAAIKDILTVLNRRSPITPIIIYPTKVQGKLAKEEIITSIKNAEKHNVCDLLIITRGGGSIEDLWPFNEENVAHAIFNCKIPIISGIGHETDFTISDLVADQRAATPSAAAEIATKDQKAILRDLKVIEKKLIQTTIQKISYLKDKTIWIKKRLRDPRTQIKNNIVIFKNVLHNLRKAMNKKLETKRANFSSTAKNLNAISPLATLSRGYSITTNLKNKKIIKNSKEIKTKDKINVKFEKGSANCIVETVNNS